MGLKVIDGTPTAISKYIEEEENKMEKEFNLSCPICGGNNDKCDCKIPEEFNLSDWITETNKIDVVAVKGLKEFIKRLKNLFCLNGDDNCHCSRYWSIDKLAGDKLKC